MGFGAALSAPNVSGSTATYSLSSSSSLTATTLSDGFAEDVVLTSAPTAQPVYEFPLSLSGGLTPRLTAGTLQFVNPDGTVAAVSRPLQAWDAQRDAAGDPSNTSPLSASLSQDGSDWTLNLTPSSTWLQDSGTVYPVTVDPTVVLSYTSAGDTFYSSGGTTDHSGDYYLQVGQTKASGPQYRAFMKWNTGQFTGLNVQTATLSLYQYDAGSCANEELDIYPTTTYDDPNADNVHWNTNSDWSESASFNHGMTGCSNSPNAWQAIDVTNIVNAWSSGEFTEYGMQLQAKTENDPAFMKRFCSVNAAPSGTGHCEGTSETPSLSVTYANLFGPQTSTPMLKHRLNDRSSLSVNARTGNLVVQASDIHVGGRGLDFGFDRFYNSKDGNAGQFGVGWRGSVGADVLLQTSSSGTRWNYKSPGGANYGALVAFSTGNTNDIHTPAFGGLNADGTQNTSNGTITLTFHQSQQKYTFDDLGQSGADYLLTKQVDRNGNEIDYNYDSTTRLLKSITDTHGRTFNVIHNSNGYITAITERVPDTSGSEVAPCGTGPSSWNASTTWAAPSWTSSPRSWCYYYNANQQLSSYVDPTGAETDYSYGSGVLTTITDPPQAAPGSNGARPTTAIGYSSSQVTSLDYYRNTSGSSTFHYTFSYDTNPTDAQASSACNNDQNWSYYTTVTDVSDVHGGATKYCFEDRPNPPSPTTPNVNADTLGAKIRVVDANGHHRSMGFAPDGGVSAATQTGDGTASAGTTVYSYDANNNLQQATQPLDTGDSTAGTTYFDYNTSQSDAGATFLPSSTMTAGNSCTSMTYDTKGNLTDTYTGLAASSGTHQCSGNTGGRRSHVDYNSDGTPSDAYGPVVSNLSSLSPSDETRYIYYNTEPNKGELQNVIRPGGSCSSSRSLCTSYLYDGYSPVTGITDGDGNVTYNDYDADDRVIQVRTNGAATCTPSAGTCVKYTYDQEGNLTSRTDATGTTTYTYDLLNRPATQIQPSGTTISSTYDGAGNLTNYSQQLAGHSDTDTVSYSYDGANQLTSVNDSTGTFSYNYDANGRPTKLTTPATNNLSFTYGYTPKSGKLNGITPSPTTFPSYKWVYDKSGTDTGKVQTMTRAIGGGAGVDTDYGYDSDDHLCWVGTASFNTCSSTTNRSYGYTYDADANLRSSTDSTGSTYYGYDEDDQLCWSGGNDSDSNHPAMSLTCSAGSTPTGDMTYSDNQGNNTGTNTGPIQYKNQDQVSQLTSLSGSGPVAETYTDQGNNLRLTASSGSGASSDGYTYTTGGPLGITAITHTTGTGASATSTTTYYTRDNNGQILDSHADTTDSSPVPTYYYEQDRQGSTVALADASGNLAATYAYSPYGQVTITNGTSTTAGQNNPFRYDGGYQDPTDGYYHFGARYYDTKSHFTQADPVAGSITRPTKYNDYSYTAGDPVNSNDLNGDDILDDVAEGISDVASAGAAIADAAGAPEIGGPLGAVATASDAIKTGYDCFAGGDKGDCGTDVGSLGIDAATAGAGKAFGDGARFLGDTAGASYNIYNTFSG